MLLLAALAALVIVALAAESSAAGAETTGRGQAAAGIPSGLPAAVAQVESGGRQYDSNGNVIISSAGAIGEMQLMPGTAAEYGVDPYDPAQNVEGGTAYLNDLIAQFGDVPDALAAYNWGPSNVQRAIASGQPFPTGVQAYVNKVLGILGGQS